MHRFFVDAGAIEDNIVSVTGDDVAHITKVLRLKYGDDVTVCDGNRMDYLCKVESADKALVTLRICEKIPNEAESKTSITLYQGVPKSDKMDLIIQKCVELGVCRIVPTESARCVAKIKDGDKKRLRWQKIAEEAAKQCGRGIIPQIGDVCTFSEAINANHGLKIMPYECEKDGNLSAVLQSISAGEDIAIYIGPEGGFEQAEAENATNAGVKTVTLGKRILRCETAGIATVSAIMYGLGEWNI